jgi:alpha-L-fucosidase
MPDGRIEPRQVERLREMGQWLEKYGEGIYGTRGGPFMPGEWGAATCKENRVYLFVTQWPAKGPLQLPPLRQTITGSETLTGGKTDVQQSDLGVTLALPAPDRDPIATVVVLSVDGRATNIPPVKVP